jgi:hypothetical protein
MKLVFFKNDEEIKVKLRVDGGDMDFDYIKMIEYLHSGTVFEETEYPDDITSIEKEKIDSMIDKINESIIRDEDA